MDLSLGFESVLEMNGNPFQTAIEFVDIFVWRGRGRSSL